MKRAIVKKRYLVLALFLFVALLFSSGEAAIIIEPALINVNLSQNRSSGTFVIKNTDDTEKRYRAKAVHFIFTPEGGLKEIPPDEYSLAEWIKFNPKEFVLPPKSSKAVRYSIIPRGKLKPREYWCAIEFMPLEGAEFKSTDEKGRTFNITILSAVMVPIHGFVEGIPYSGDIKNIEVKQQEDGALYLSTTVANTGEGVINLQGTYTITDSSGAIVDQSPLKSVEVYPHQQRITKTKINKALDTNTYSVRINLTSKSPRATITLSDEAKFSL